MSGALNLSFATGVVAGSVTTRVLLTIDTELAHRHVGRSWEENLARSFDPAGVGVTWQLERLRDHGLKAVFFVDPMPALHYGLEPIQRMVEPILAAGQDVQLHIHPFWVELDDAAASGVWRELSDHPLARQHALIVQARELLVAAGAPAPIAFRAGSYAANAETLLALAALGIRYDSSHNGSHHPEPSNLPFDPALIDPVRHGGVIEIPVTQMRGANGSLRHLQLCAVSAGEMQAALRHAAAEGQPVATIVSHSFELATRDGLRPNHVYRRRFEALCAFLANHRAHLPTCHFADLDGLAEGRAEPFSGTRLVEVQRIAEQVWSDLRYERPATALTAISGSSVLGVEILAALTG